MKKRNKKGAEVKRRDGGGIGGARILARILAWRVLKLEGR